MPTPGFKSVSLHQKYYDALSEIAKQKNVSVTTLLETLVGQYSEPYVRAVIEQITTNRTDFKAPYHEFVQDLKIKRYQSTSWVRTEEYVERMRYPMLLDLESRIRKDNALDIDKVFILSKESWGKKEVWKWITQWLTFKFYREDQINLFVIREKVAAEILAAREPDEEKRKRYYDMGIYAVERDKWSPNDAVGFLKIGTRSEPDGYDLVRFGDDTKEVKRAEDCFEVLQRKARSVKDIIDLRELQQEDYDSQVVMP